MIKKLRSYEKIHLLLLSLCLVMISCDKKTVPSISINQSDIPVSDAGGSKSISFESNVNWTAKSSESWCTVSPSNGDALTKGITVNLAANDTYDARSSTVTIMAESLSKTITINQNSNSGLLVTNNKYDLSYDATSIEVEVQANIEYDVTISGEWITRNTTRGLSSKKLHFDIAKNQDYDNREGFIIIKQKGGSLTETIIVYQSVYHFIYRSMGYIAGYDYSMKAENINWDGLTHAMVFSVMATSTGGLDITYRRGSASEGEKWADGVIQAAHAAGKKAFLTIGGAGTYTDFKDALSSVNSRSLLVSSLLEHIDAHSYDGLDIDYEPMRDADVPNILLFIDALKSARSNLMISICSGQFNANHRSFYLSNNNLNEIGKRVDMLNLMTYGMVYGTKEGWQSWHSSPVYGHGRTTPMDIDFDVSTCINAGIPARKIGIGAGFFGVGLTGCTEPKKDFTAVVENDGALKYKVIVADYLPYMTRVWDDVSKVPYLWSSVPFGASAVNYISYDDAQSLAAKSEYIKSKGIGGMIMWHVAHQYISTAPAGQKHPLLNSIRDSLLH